MNRRFGRGDAAFDTGLFRVADGTLVNPFLNPFASSSELPVDFLAGAAIAAGRIEAGTKSRIAVHPHIFEVTVLLAGTLRVHMKDPARRTPYAIELSAAHGAGGFPAAAVATEPGTFFQLDNTAGTEDAHVLYVTSPGFIFEPGPTAEDPPVYDDAVVFEDSWQWLANCDWAPPSLFDPARSAGARAAARSRILRR